jgi:Tol biopolymer transport system component/DNA-binding winged helix-turn-helix (wHTH) protein/Flp pilus assembly protein TadD
VSSGATSIQSQFNLNSDKSNFESIYEFEDFRLDAAHLMLYRNGQPLALAPKVVETLVALVERRGEIVSKKEMMNRLWADSFVEEANLTQNIYLLRKTLGKGADGRDLIETFRRRGYRFTGAIKNVAAKAADEEARANETPFSSQPTEKIKTVPGEVFDSLAVLPLINQSDDADAEYLSDGVTESVINRLTQISSLRVVARSTVFQYKNREVAPQQIGRALGVSAVLTGRVLQHDDRLIVRAELVDAANGWQIWGAQYDRRAADVLELQETLAREISENLRLKLTGEERRRLTKRYTESSEAYHLYIKARFFLNKRLTETIEQAAALFQQAIDVDPAFAPAYVGLADCYPLLSLYGTLTPDEAYPQAKAAALRALEIDDGYTKAYNSLGVIKLFYEWDRAGAEEAFQKAIELNPGYPDAHQRYGMLLTTQGRFDEAITEFKRARDLDPLSLITKTISGYPFYYSRRFETAEECFREVIAMDANYSMAHFRLGLTLAQQKKYDEAIAELSKAVELSNDRDSIAALGFVQGLAGDAAPAEAAFRELDEREKKGFVTSYNRVLLEIGLQNYDAALDWLERAFEERSYWLIYLKFDPALDALRENARFKILEEKIFGADEKNARNAPKAFVEKSAAPLAESGKQKRYFAIAAAAMVALVLLAIFVAPWLFDSKRANQQNQTAAPNLKITRLTPDLNAFATAFTPDGENAVYVSRDKGKQSVWLKDLTTGGARQILPPDGDGYDEPHFSRDGKWIYYATARPNKPNKTLVRVPSAGGAAEEIAFSVVSPFVFSPDEKQIAFINGNAGDLHLANADGSGERVLAKRDAKRGWFESWGSNLSWSAVHNLIAVCGGRYGADGKPYYKLLLINPADGAESVVPTPVWNYLDDVRWLGDGSGFIVVARETEASPFQLWRVSYPEGAVRRITNDLSDYTNLALSPDSRRLLTNRHLAHLNLWIAPWDAPERARQISFGSTAEDGMWGIAFTPDGKIIYTSPRGGAVDLWQISADGGEPKQLTKNAGEWNAQPRITPDGKTIVFASRRSGRNQIWRMDADGGNPKQLTDEFWAGEPDLSPDGAEIYFKIDDGDKAFIAKIPLEGGAPVRVSKTPHNSVGMPSPSPDGKLIFCQFYDRDSGSPWKSGILDAATGEMVKVFDFFISGTAVWTPDSKALIYSPRHNANLWRVSLETGAKPQQLTDFENGGAIRTFAVSPDFKQFAISRGAATYEAILLENF